MTCTFAAASRRLAQRVRSGPHPFPIASSPYLSRRLIGGTVPRFEEGWKRRNFGQTEGHHTRWYILFCIHDFIFYAYLIALFHAYLIALFHLHRWHLTRFMA